MLSRSGAEAACEWTDLPLSERCSLCVLHGRQATRGCLLTQLGHGFSMSDKYSTHPNLVSVEVKTVLYCMVQGPAVVLHVAAEATVLLCLH